MFYYIYYIIIYLYIYIYIKYINIYIYIYIYNALNHMFKVKNDLIPDTFQKKFHLISY